MSRDETEIHAAMATRDLMSATQTLAELPCELLDAEYDDIALTYSELGRLLEDHAMRRLRQRTCGHPEAVVHAMAVRQVPENQGA